MAKNRGSAGRVIGCALVGAVVAIPVPIVGPIIGLIAGGCVGYFYPSKNVSAAKEYAPTSNGLAKLVLAAGAILMGYAILMDTSVQSIGVRVNNLGLMRDQQNLLIVSSVMIIAGVILLFVRQGAPTVPAVDPFDEAAATRSLDRKRYAISLGIERSDGQYIWGGHCFTALDDAIDFVEAEKFTARRRSEYSSKGELHDPDVPPQV